MVIPAPLVRSRTSVSPDLSSSCMASQQEADQEQFPGMVRHSSPELIRISMRPSVAARRNWTSNSCQKRSIETISGLQSDRTGAKRPPGNIQRPAGLKIACFRKMSRPPRFSQTCIGEQWARIKTAVPPQKQKNCCGEDTRPPEGGPLNAWKDRSEFWRQLQPFPPP